MTKQPRAYALGCVMSHLRRWVMTSIHISDIHNIPNILRAYPLGWGVSHLRCWVMTSIHISNISQYSQHSQGLRPGLGHVAPSVLLVNPRHIVRRIVRHSFHIFAGTRPDTWS